MLKKIKCYFSGHTMECVNKCTGECACRYCGHKEYIGQKHAWDEGEYISQMNCKKLLTCVRCGSQREAVRHQWGEWLTNPEQKCAKTRYCLRCGEEETTVSHIWEKFYVDGGEYDKCKQCGEKSRIYDPEKEAWCSDDY